MKTSRSWLILILLAGCAPAPKASPPPQQEFQRRESLMNVANAGAITISAFLTNNSPSGSGTFFCMRAVITPAATGSTCDYQVAASPTSAWLTATNAIFTKPMTNQVFEPLATTPAEIMRLRLH